MRASLVYGVNSNDEQHEWPIDSTSVSKELPLNLNSETVLHCSKAYFLSECCLPPAASDGLSGKRQFAVLLVGLWRWSHSI